MEAFFDEFKRTTTTRLDALEESANLLKVKTTSLESMCGDQVDHSALANVQEDVTKLYTNYLTVSTAVFKLIDAKDQIQDDFTLIKSQVLALHFGQTCKSPTQ